MKLLLAIDSFKESLSSKEAAETFARGFRKGFPMAHFETLLVADGGEGFTDALVNNGKGRKSKVKICDPLFRPIVAEWGMLPDGSVVLETAVAAGLMQLKPKERNPLKTTTYGLGLLIKAALDKKPKKIILGLGGSATNDGGAGMLQALGVRFLGKNGKVLATPFRGEDLRRVEKIDVSGLDSRLFECKITAACDVDNPLFGPKGAACIYAPQKGADAAMVRDLDSGLKHYAAIVKRTLPKSNANLPGSGAAGGLGFALKAVLGASLVSGINLMLEAANFSSRVKQMDLVVTGEGRMDGQTASNKAPYGIARASQKAKVPVIGVCGALTPEIEKLYAAGFCGVYSIVPGPVTLELALKNASINLERTAESLGRTFSAFYR